MKTMHAFLGCFAGLLLFASTASAGLGFFNSGPGLFKCCCCDERRTCCECDCCDCCDDCCCEQKCECNSCDCCCDCCCCEPEPYVIICEEDCRECVPCNSSHYFHPELFGGYQMDSCCCLHHEWYDNDYMCHTHHYDNCRCFNFWYERGDEECCGCPSCGCK